MLCNSPAQWIRKVATNPMSKQQKHHNLAATKYPPMKTHPYFNFIILPMWTGQVLNKNQLNERKKKQCIHMHQQVLCYINTNHIKIKKVKTNINEHRFLYYYKIYINNWSMPTSLAFLSDDHNKEKTKAEESL